VHLEVARKFEKLAKSAFLQASKSVEDAEARLEAATQQYEVINVDSDEDDEVMDDGDKKPAGIPVAQSKGAHAASSQAAASAGSNERAAALSSQAGAQSKSQRIKRKALKPFLSGKITSKRKKFKSRETRQNIFLS
jgi:hypothetical protein